MLDASHIDDSALSDIAANMVAALMLVLLILSQIPKQTTPFSVAQPVPVEKSFHMTMRQPLSPLQMVELLRARQPQQPGMSIDIREDQIDITEAGRLTPLIFPHPASTRARVELQDQLQALFTKTTLQEPVRLYVFQNEEYEWVRDVLERLHLRFIELSVPAALRNEAGTNWLEEFQALIQHPPDLPTFRIALADILARHQPLNKDKQVGGGREKGFTGFSSPISGYAGGWTSALPSFSAFIASLVAILKHICNMLAIAAGFWIIRRAHRLTRSL